MVFMKKINVGIIGVGNCASALIQGIEIYKRKRFKLMHEKMGKYKISDINFTSAFDISKHKVNKFLDEAVYSKPNMVSFIRKLPRTSVIVSESPILDGVGKHVINKFSPIKQSKNKDFGKNIGNELEQSKTHVLINFLPVGSQRATEFWAKMAIDHGCAFVNCIPVFIASRRKWSEKFARVGVPVIGDDIKSQLGSTIVHRVLVKLCEDRGVSVDRTTQLNWGGNTDFLNMLELERLKYKKISKTEAVQSQFRKRLAHDNIEIGPAGYISNLKNIKRVLIVLKGKTFAEVPFGIKLEMNVNDKSNSAGVTVDAIRCAQLALDRKIGGPLISASSYYMKHPPIQFSDSDAKKMVEMFSRGKRRD